MKIKNKIIIFLSILFIIPSSYFLYHYARIRTYSKERAMEKWEERIEIFINSEDSLNKEVDKIISDSLK